MPAQTLQGGESTQGSCLPFTPALGLVVPEPFPRPTSAGLREGMCCTEGGQMRSCGGSWPIPDSSLVLRPWIQDIEGANARELCNTSSSKARTFVYQEVRCPVRVEEMWGV